MNFWRMKYPASEILTAEAKMDIVRTVGRSDFRYQIKNTGKQCDNNYV